GKVTIRGQCVDCNRPEEESTTPKSSSSSHDHAAHSHGQGKAAADDDDLQQISHVAHSSSPRYRLKRQWGGRQVITLDGPDADIYRGGPVTTLDSRGYPGTLVRNSDCVGCNIRG
ncbi:hypothetical protein KR093_010116, partial [Drosophila rubida]